MRPQRWRGRFGAMQGVSDVTGSGGGPGRSSAGDRRIGGRLSLSVRILCARKIARGDSSGIDDADGGRASPSSKGTITRGPRFEPHLTNEGSMKNANRRFTSEMRPECDFASMKGGVRGKYAAQYRSGTKSASRNNSTETSTPLPDGRGSERASEPRPLGSG